LVRVHCNPKKVEKGHGFHPIWHRFRLNLVEDSIFMV
jgi:hypothetical protein